MRSSECTRIGGGHESSALAALLALVPSLVVAQDGDLDPTFGVGGVGNVSTILYDNARAVTVDSHGRVYVAFVQYNSGQTIYISVVARLTAAGQLDTSFDVDGLSTLVLDVGGYDKATPNGLVVQPDGRIVVAGFASSPTSPDRPRCSTVSCPTARSTPASTATESCCASRRGRTMHFIEPVLNRGR